MGGSASGGNAQLFDLMNKYGTNGGSENTYAGMSMNDALTAEQNRQIRAGAGNGQGDPKFDDFSLLFSAISAFNGGNGGGGGGGGSGSGNAVTQGGGNPVQQQQQFQWQFPQYSQTWAFTPPTPTPYLYPKPFDTSIYGNPYSKKPNK